MFEYRKFIIDEIHDNADCNEYLCDSTEYKKRKYYLFIENTISRFRRNFPELFITNQ